MRSFPPGFSLICLRILLVLLLAALPLSAEPLPAGKGKLTLPLGEHPIDVFTYRPAQFKSGPLLVVMHGLGRNVEGYRDYAIPLADRSGALLVAPYFDAERFPTAAYQRGNVLKDGKAAPREEWTYQYIARLIAEIRQREARPDMPCYLIGHSAGGQFLTRFAAFLPGDAVRIVAANPGSHLFPTRDLPFPYGFGELPEELGGDAAIQRYLAAPLTLLLGTADVGSENLDTKPEAMKQGATRIERGRNCFRLAQETAQKHGWPFHWRVVEVEGIGHEGSKMIGAPEAAVALFGDAKPGETKDVKR